MKAVTNLIQVVILVIIVVVLISYTFIFFSNYFSETQRSSKTTINKTLQTLNAGLSIESISETDEGLNTSIFVRNTGNQDLTQIAVFIDNSLATIESPQIIRVDSVATIKILRYISNGNHQIKISTAEGAESIKNYDPCNGSNVVLCLGFDEGLGTTAKDDSFYENNGTISGSPSWTQGRYNQALNFNGINNYISLPNNTNLNMTGNFFVSVWLKPNALDNFTIIGDDLGSFFKWRITTESSLAGNIIEFRLGLISVRTGSLLNTNYWHYMKGIYNFTHITLYIHREDGLNEISSSTAGFPITTLSGNKLIGKNHTTKYFNGLIDEIRIKTL